MDWKTYIPIVAAVIGAGGAITAALINSHSKRADPPTSVQIVPAPQPAAAAPPAASAVAPASRVDPKETMKKLEGVWTWEYFAVDQVYRQPAQLNANGEFAIFPRDRTSDIFYYVYLKPDVTRWAILDSGLAIVPFRTAVSSATGKIPPAPPGSSERTFYNINCTLTVRSLALMEGYCQDGAGGRTALRLSR